MASPKQTAEIIFPTFVMDVLYYVKRTQGEHIMVSETTYKALQMDYGDMASWAVWQRPGATPKSHTGDMSVFNDPDLLSILNLNYVFVGFNGSGKHDNYLALNKPWFNFHSGAPYQNDYKLRYALLDTSLWGSYITDIIKGHQEPDSRKVKKHLREHPEVAEKNVIRFRQEMKLHGGHPVLIALGDDAYDILTRYLKGDFIIKKIPHYSRRDMSKEQYRSIVRNLLEELKLGGTSMEPAVIEETSKQNKKDVLHHKAQKGKKLLNGLRMDQYVNGLAELLDEKLNHEVVTDKAFVAAGRRVRSGIKSGPRDDFIHILRKGSNNNLIEIYIKANMCKASILVKERSYEQKCPFQIPHDIDSHQLLRYTLEESNPDQLSEAILRFLIEADRILSNL